MSDPAKAHVARLFFLEELSKQEIAQRMRISRFKVARLLAQARVEGIVRIEIDDPVGSDEAVARDLRERFGLELAVVVPAPEALAQATAAWLPEWLQAGSPLGVGWGSTLSAVAQALPARPELGIDVIQMCGAIPGLQPGTTPVELTLGFAAALGGHGHVLPAPALASRAARAELLAHEAVAPTVARWEQVRQVLVGVGGRLPGAPKGAVGHLLVQSFDAGGGLVTAAPAQATIAADAAHLRRARVIAVAGGPAKHAAVRGALRTGLIDIMVCDVATAEHALGET